ncbi:hypothetical protein ACFUIT_20950 [Streptomyces sp. NPDC057239]|uniref:hypothetical protein n=1 Tax=Streptomyces sp. NPDC057239 TaxID=3346061 RepID=UPI00363FD7D0
MYDFIRRVVRWPGLLFGPGTGAHRAGDPRPAHLTVRPTGSARLPLHRSPYCRHLPLDGAESRLVRPYLDLDQYVVGAGKVAA